MSGEATTINWSYLTESKKDVKASDQKASAM